MPLQPHPPGDTAHRGPAPGKRILIAGASSDIGLALIRTLCSQPTVIGAHYFKNRLALEDITRDRRLNEAGFRLIQGNLSAQTDCHRLVDEFVSWAGGIDGLVQLTGNVANPCSWEDLQEASWLADINLNLSGPFFLAQCAMRHMKSSGGRIVLTSTASARHGGGLTSIAYGVAKAGIECLTKGLARAGAPHNILVNAIAPGLIDTKFHSRSMGRDPEAIRKRAALVLLKRAGEPSDVASMIAYLLSPQAGYITGECIAISGGDWL